MGARPVVWRVVLVEVGDFDRDGLVDLLVGGLGLNTEWALTEVPFSENSNGSTHEPRNFETLCLSAG